MRLIDEDFFAQVQVDKQTAEKTLEERMLAFQKECDKRVAEEVQSKVKLFEESIVSAMRLEESAKFREKLATLREEMEQAYMKKLAQISQREKDIVVRLETKEKELDKMLFDHRQKMIHDIQNMDEQWAQVKKEQRELDNAKLAFEDKTQRLNILANQYSNDFKSELNTYKAKLDKQYADSLEMLTKERAILASDKQKLEEKQKDHHDTHTLKETLSQTKTALHSIKAELEDARNRNRVLETIVDTLKMELAKQNKGETVESTNLKQQCMVLSKEMEHCKLQEQKLVRDNLTLEQKLTEAQHTIASLQDELDSQEEESSLMHEQELAKLKEHYKAFVQQWMNEKELLGKRIQEKSDYVSQLQQKLEEQHLQCRSLQYEVDSLNQLLKQTQYALESALSSKHGTTPMMPVLSISKPTFSNHPAVTVFQQDFPKSSLTIQHIEKTTSPKVARDKRLLDEIQQLESNFKQALVLETVPEQAKQEDVAQKLPIQQPEIRIEKPKPIEPVPVETVEQVLTIPDFNHVVSLPPNNTSLSPEKIAMDTVLQLAPQQNTSPLANHTTIESPPKENVFNHNNDEELFVAPASPIHMSTSLNEEGPVEATLYQQEDGEFDGGDFEDNIFKKEQSEEYDTFF